MSVFETNSRVGSDGKLHVTVPAEFVGKDVRVVVEDAVRVNGGPAHAGFKPATSEEWRRFAARTSGSVPDFPDVARPGPDQYEKRDW